MLAHPVSSASGREPEGFGPGDFAARRLQVEHEVDGLADHRPHLLGEPPVVGDQDVVPDPGGDVGAEVAVAVGVLDDAVAQLDRPRAVGPLVARHQSNAARAGSSSPAAVSAIAFSTWSHGSVCPPSDHGMAPDDSCVAAIDSAVCRHCAGSARRHAGYAVRSASPATAPASRSTARRSCRSAGSARLGRPGQPGPLIMSHTSSLW